MGAHLDDIELAASGTAARLVNAGAQVRFLVMSTSEYTSYNGSHFCDADVAVAEGREAAATLGVKEIDILRFPAKDVENHSAVVESINEVVDDFRATMVFTHWPFNTHRSHANTGLATIAASRYDNSVVMYEPIVPSGRSYVGFRPQLYISIEQKLQALRQHKSEYEKYGEHLDRRRRGPIALPRL
ncbi:PIG-L deacetylase family protein [Streptomyces sp. V4I2]|uniref:PIG-L deacetylase family protein n=1 Tax=Streptomyces sp. V4I2 TaxID=3042280 RepID=UPI002789F55F|nr:PIG-L family deacetylase [Streptomyces sp. V4I2]MDQ1048319.1 LmbE family N-acetylglucosaminyl deacetylase [Streptomyces sp. V4I2]